MGDAFILDHLGVSAKHMLNGMVQDLLGDIGDSPIEVYEMAR